MKPQDSLYRILWKESTEKGARYVLSLDAQHFIYQAHFPGQPITPGVCMVQMGLEVLSDFLQRELQLNKVNNVKFLSVLSPEETTEVVYEITKLSPEAEGLSKAQLAVYHQDTVYAKISLTVQ